MNKKQQDDQRLLLESIIKGGQKGQVALKQLRQFCHPIILKIASECSDRPISSLLVRQGMNAFEDILREFIYDHEVMDEFENFLSQRLRSVMKRKMEVDRILKKAQKGWDMDPMLAMQLMTRLYMDSCGISLTERTMAYDAGWIWLDKYNEIHPEEKRWDADASFVEVMPILCEDYTDEEYGKYDICHLDTNDKFHYAAMMIQDMDEDMAVALCWAIDIERMRQRKPYVWQLLKVMVDEDEMLDTTERALFSSKEDAEKEMERWTTHQPENLLCFVVRQLPMKKAYHDDFCPFDRDLDMPWQEENSIEEHVYSPSGFERKYNFQKGDLVTFIFHDIGYTCLGKGVVYKVPSDNEDCYVILIDETSTDISELAFIDCAVRIPSRYVFPFRS